jgi:hypothetical protein
VRLTETRQWTYEAAFGNPIHRDTSGLLKPAGVLTEISVSRNVDSGTGFGKFCLIRKCFHRSSIETIFEISQELRNKIM